MIMHALYKLLKPKYRTVKVTYEESMLNAQLADSFVKNMFGLMFKDRLEKDTGMLFVLGTEGRMEAGIWMLNMKFSIDVIWMDRGGRIVDIAEELAPCKSLIRCRTYVPKSRAKYVLELNAGSVRGYGMKVGETIGLPEVGRRRARP